MRLQVLVSIMHAPELVAHRAAAHLLKTHPSAFLAIFVPLYASPYIQEHSLRSDYIRLARSHISAPPTCFRDLAPPSCRLVGHMNMPDQWRWNEIPSYRLNKVDVANALVKLFGNYDFGTKVRRLADFALPS